MKSSLPVNLFAMLLALCLGAASSAWAADEGKHDSHDTNAHSHADGKAHSHAGAEADAAHHDHTVHGGAAGSYFGKGTEFLHVSPVLLVWTIVVFLVTSWLLRKLAWEPILAAIHEREHRIAESFRQAELARSDAKELLARHDEEMGRAHDKAKELLDAAREEATRESEALIAKARTDAAFMQETALREIAAAKQEALAELRGSVASLSSGIASKLAERELRSEEIGYMTEGNGQ